MKRLQRIMVLLISIVLLCSFTTTAFAVNTETNENSSLFQPGSGGMLARDEFGNVTFISGDEILAYNHDNKSLEASVPAPSSINPRTIISGNLTPVDPSKATPVVLIGASFPSLGYSLGTGFMMGPTGIATAAHNIYDKNNDEWAESIDIYFKFSEGSYQKKVTGYKGMYIGGEYRNTPLDDWGIIELNSAPNVGYYGIRATDNVSSVYNKSIHAFGYTNYFHNNNLTLQDFNLASTSGEIKTQWLQRALPGVTITCDVTPGMSGGPLLEVTNDYALGFIVTQFKDSDYFNGGLLINSWLSNAYVEHSGR